MVAHDKLSHVKALGNPFAQVLMNTLFNSDPIMMGHHWIIQFRKGDCAAVLNIRWYSTAFNPSGLKY